MISPVIYSDDGRLNGFVEYHGHSSTYIARILRVTSEALSVQIDYKAFGNGTDAENWLLDRLECPLFTILSK